MTTSADNTGAGSLRRKRGQRRGTVVLATAAAALAAFGSTTQTWLSVALPQTAVQTPDLSVPGSEAATAVTAFALVGLAAGLAASIAGPIARWIIAVILTVAGAGITWSTLSVAADPAAAAAPAIGEALGVTGQAGVVVSGTAMPWVAAAAGVLLVACAAWLLVAGRTWGAAKRYEKSGSRGSTSRPATASDEIDSWDSLTRGEDPTN
ncbi:hypothetical protein GC088_07125 [Arthrobacter sp. JZ12]|uniref:Trp biosynthesis-associated membrane protein n=1 Tax=Arthrobacter sp. JZ12 TaxID=2654190 RepID=UPI002B498CC2|nr:Trp biosynthesis-associated membrane protein [Arthrobacter sp. JZ12]WRH24864.1 hypothetical protein GC088_07125 [Arthrobacter sp. JZ12]